MLIDSMLQKGASGRPRFSDLAAACDRDEYTLSKWPALKWLAKPLADPLEFVLELTRLNKDVVLKSTDAVEQVVTYIRKFLRDKDGNIVDAAGAAFDAADEDKNGLMTNQELLEVINPDGSKEVNAMDLAAFMRRYTEKPTITREQLQKLALDWQFGGRDIVYRSGKNKSRCFAFPPRPGHVANEEECKDLARHIKDAAQKKMYTIEDVSEETEKEIERATGFRQVCFSVGMLEKSSTEGKELCHVRCNVFSFEEAVVLETKVVWGSIIEEMEMLKNMNDAIHKVWGNRIPLPEALIELQLSESSNWRLQSTWAVPGKRSSLDGDAVVQDYRKVLKRSATTQVGAMLHRNSQHSISNELINGGS